MKRGTRAKVEAGFRRMGYRALAGILRLRFTQEQHRAAQYLERQGLHFCIDWGRDNAVTMAREHWRARRQRVRRRAARG